MPEGRCDEPVGVRGEHTPMERLLGEALAEFELDEPADVPGSLCVVRCPMSGRCANIAYQECMMRMQARVRSDSEGDCSPRSDAGGVMRDGDAAEVPDALWVMG